ncbi:hypothetical protein Atai01_34620 [Amycolatopsis taiwanensis]|uniref:Uncharacterized protein n=2 Tax=Amycolatopsis taiwanensis TaxID=342230 RepID=A0A9W6R023_9PSEU|nr:hypothetical protein Atai01_34620 [Amycolatopsis taiwanensis]
MSPNVAVCLRTVAEELLAALEAQEARRPFRRARRLADEHLFPDAYDTKEESMAFRQRHGDAMRETVTATVRRVATEWAGQAAFTMNRRAAHDWLVTYTHAQALVLGRPRWKPNLQTWERLPSGQAEVTMRWLVYLGAALIDALIGQPWRPEVLLLTP